MKSLRVNMPVVYVSSRADNKLPPVPVYPKYLSVGNETMLLQESCSKRVKPIKALGSESMYIVYI